MNLITVYDATGANIGHLPAGQHAAGYTTGSGGIAWTAADWAAHPGAVRIDQDPAASDHTADVLDVERGAATIADVVPWVRAAHADRADAVRPGQRWPAIYVSQSGVTAVANVLKAAGIVSGVFLWIADWGIGTAAADHDVLSAGGPWPVIGVQYSSQQYYDVSVFSASWLGNVAGAPKPPPPPVHTFRGLLVINSTTQLAPPIAKSVTSTDGKTWS